MNDPDPDESLNETLDYEITGQHASKILKSHKLHADTVGQVLRRSRRSTVGIPASPITQTNIKEINRLHAKICGMAKMTVEDAIRVGKLLTEEKSKLKHGEWIPWIKKNLKFTARTATNYMRIFDKQELLKSENLSDLATAYRVIGILNHVAPEPQTPSPETNRQIRELVEVETQGKLSYITISALLHRPGWTRELIDEILGNPDFLSRGSSGCAAKLYSVLRVDAAETYLSARDGTDSPVGSCGPLSQQSGAISNGYCGLRIHAQNGNTQPQEHLSAETTQVPEPVPAPQDDASWKSVPSNGVKCSQWFFNHKSLHPGETHEPYVSENLWTFRSKRLTASVRVNIHSDGSIKFAINRADAAKTWETETLPEAQEMVNNWFSKLS